MLVPQPPGASRTSAAKPARKTPPQALAKPLAEEPPKTPVVESLPQPVAPPRSIELPVSLPPALEPELALPPLPPRPISPVPDYSFTSRGELIEPPRQATAEMPSAPLPTMTPEPAMAPLASAAALDSAPAAAEFLSPLSIELPPTVPVAVVPEPPLESLPPLTSFDHEPLLDEPMQEEQFARPAFELPQASFNPEPTATAQTGGEAFFAQPAIVPLLPPPETDMSLEFEYDPKYEDNERGADRIGLPPRPSIVDDDIDEAVTLRRSRGVEFFSWLRNLLPARPEHVPANAIEPTWQERRTARGLAAALVGVALLTLLPLVLTRHVDLRTAPPWALWVVILAMVQLIFAGWLANVPDWATVRMQMVLSAGLTTIYAMAMTLVLLTPQARSLILGLDEVRRLAPAWCGLMVLIMGIATWYCGRTSARWREQLVNERLDVY